MDVSVCALIPARGGSKGIPRKNLCLFRGKPLIVHTIEQALAASTVDRVIVTTDDDEILRVAREAGAEVPFLRPPDIAQDLSTDFEFMQHYVQWQTNSNIGKLPGIIVQLRPTYPTRSAAFIDKCIRAFNPVTHSSLRTVIPYEKSPFKMYTINGDVLNPLFENFEGLDEPYNACRQALPQAYLHNGCVDITTPDCILSGSITGKRIQPMVMDACEIMDIDTEKDLLRISLNPVPQTN